MVTIASHLTPLSRLFAMSRRLSVARATVIPSAGARDLIVQLQHMPARRRQVLTLRFVYGLAQTDVAHRLGLSESQVSAEIAAGLRAVAASEAATGGEA